MIIFEDEHLLVFNKPLGLNTHSPSPFAGEGLFEWLKNREPRWSNLSILHRLDKETSGVILFGKTPLANRSLSEQFAERRVAKKYRLLTDRNVTFKQLNVESVLVRAGEKYLSRPLHPTGDRAETRFHILESVGPHLAIEAEPVTGKTHQIRVHAAANGFPILGDSLYGGTASARLFLHASEISIRHPSTNERMTFVAPNDFSNPSRLSLRDAVIDPAATNSYRLINGGADGWAGWYVEKVGDYILSQSESLVSASQRLVLEGLMAKFFACGVYHKLLNRRVRGIASTVASPQLVLGEPAPPEFLIRENGIQFSLSFNEGYSMGLFLDQRENRRRFLSGYIAPDFSLRPEPGQFAVLNTFAYTCGFSVCAAKAGANVTSLDLSKKYLEWGKRNFAINEINVAPHDFIFGDAFDWMKRLNKKKRAFDVIVLDPPTFSQSKEQGTFQAERDYSRLVTAALPLLKSRGVLLASTNAANLLPETFLDSIRASVESAKRKIAQQHYVPQPIDFPVSRDEPAYLKTVWMRIV